METTKARKPRRAKKKVLADHRLAFRVTAESKDTIELLTERLDARSVAETLRRMMAITTELLEHVDAGGKIVFEHPDGSKERVRFP